MTICLKRDYCISISSGRVYRLMKQMNLPKMTTQYRPRFSAETAYAGDCQNILAQHFNQPSPNMVWAANFTCIRVNGRFYYICAIMDLFARKIIACRVSNKNRQIFSY